MTRKNLGLTYRLTLNVTKDEYENLDRLSNQLNTSRSAIIRWSFREFMLNYDANDTVLKSQSKSLE